MQAICRMHARMVSLIKYSVPILGRETYLGGNNTKSGFWRVMKGKEILHFPLHVDDFRRRC